MGLPTPRPVPHKPFVQFWPSIAWTTLALTINADGSSSHELVGRQPVPAPLDLRQRGKLAQKSGVIDFGKGTTRRGGQDDNRAAFSARTSTGIGGMPS